MKKLHTAWLLTVGNKVFSVYFTFKMMSDCKNICFFFSDGPENVRIIGPSKIHVKQPLNLTCFAESTPWATYTWTLNGTEIHNSSVFTKDNTELSDSGDYTCRAMNNITGKTSSFVHHLSVTGTKIVLIADFVDALGYCD